MTSLRYTTQYSCGNNVRVLQLTLDGRLGEGAEGPLKPNFFGTLPSDFRLLWLPYASPLLLPL